MKVLGWNRGSVIMYFEEGVFAGQTIRWLGEGLANGTFSFFPFAANKYALSPRNN